MKELLRSNDVVLLSYVDARLREAAIEPILLDTHTSILEGSIGAIPRRLMVADADHARALVIVDAALAEANANDSASAQGQR